MALINCPDCNKEISDKAPTCPGCGAPIAKDQEAAGSGVAHLITTQETSKHLKIHSLVSGAMMIIGFTWVIVATQANAEPSAIPSFMIGIGMIWYIVNRFRIWWHHK